MQFTEIPDDYAPLGGALVYRLEAGGTATFDLTLRDCGTDEAVAARRLVETASASFDAAPVLRRRLRFGAAAGSTGFADAADRAVMAVLEADGVRSPVRTFLPRMQPVSPPALLTTLPMQRFVVRGGCEELTLLSGTPCTAEVEAADAEGRSLVQRYVSPRSGLQLFRLQTADFPDAEHVTVRFDRFAQVSWQIIGSRTGGCRVAWRSTAGSVEHYDFPIVAEERLETERSGVASAAGRRTTRVAARRRLTLRSAYEPTEVLRALAGIAAASQVWVVGEEGYAEAEPLTDALVMRRHGTLLNVEVQLGLPEPLPWN